jgi:hypothetical protein
MDEYDNKMDEWDEDRCAEYRKHCERSYAGGDYIVIDDALWTEDLSLTPHSLQPMLPLTTPPQTMPPPTMLPPTKLPPIMTPMTKPPPIML